jgi:DNA-binding NarL/FixJ family response regulator
VSIRAAAGASKAVQPRLKLSGTPTETGGAPIRVLIVDDHDIVREGLVGLLSNYAEIEIVGEACDGATAVTMARELKPDVVLMDVTMPGIGGIEATRQIVTNEPSIRVIGLSMHEEQDVVDQMMRAGAVDYMNKGGPYDGLIATILGRADA